PFGFGRESGGGRAGQRRRRPGTERSLAPEAAQPARGHGGAERWICSSVKLCKNWEVLYQSF
ncbi:hypothetical protein Nmel_005313, partial [Mimus melanotis]